MLRASITWRGKICAWRRQQQHQQPCENRLGAAVWRGAAAIAWQHEGAEVQHRRPPPHPTWDSMASCASVSSLKATSSCTRSVTSFCTTRSAGLQAGQVAHGSTQVCAQVRRHSARIVRLGRRAWGWQRCGAMLKWVRRGRQTAHRCRWPCRAPCGLWSRGRKRGSLWNKREQERAQ